MGLIHGEFGLGVEGLDWGGLLVTAREPLTVSVLQISNWRSLLDRSVVRAPWIGLPGRTGCLFRKTVLKSGVAELVHRPDDAQDLALAGILKEPHEPYRRMPA